MFFGNNYFVLRGILLKLGQAPREKKTASNGVRHFGVSKCVRPYVGEWPFLGG
jgi:hypothetical protein